MKKVTVILFALLFVVGVGLASAAQNVGGLSQKGSVIVFPKIDTRNGLETYIKITNDNSVGVTIKCYWVSVDGPIYLGSQCVPPPNFVLPPAQVPTDFTISLTAYQPIMFAASTGFSNDPIAMTVNPFGADKVGYLACWAVDNAQSGQINFNHLMGDAIVVGPTSGYEYSSWNFQARSNVTGGLVGVPGTIKFDAIKFDSMPQYLMYTIPTLGSYNGLFADVNLTLMQGKQDFNTMTLLHPVTKAVFDVWNENETRFSGIGACMYCWLDTLLDSGVIKNGALFRVGGMNTSVARFRVQGKASTGCLPQLSEFDQERCLGSVITTQSSGLLSVAVQEIGPFVSDSVPLYLTTIGPNTAGQSVDATFVWSPDGGVVPER